MTTVSLNALRSFLACALLVGVTAQSTAWFCRGDSITAATHAKCCCNHAAADADRDAGISRAPCCTSEVLSSSSQPPSTSSLAEYAPASPVLVEARAASTALVAAAAASRDVVSTPVDPALVRVDTGPPIRVRLHSFLI